MPKGSAELTNARREEILAACRKLYETMSFKEITLKEIGQQTSFTRTSIYNYFETKEEIFLALFQREYELFARELDELCLRRESLSPDELASALAHALERRPLMLKLLSMNLYDMEANSRRSVKGRPGPLPAEVCPRTRRESAANLPVRFPPLCVRSLPLHRCDGQAAGCHGAGGHRLCLYEHV